MDSGERWGEVRKFSNEALARYPELIASIVVVGSVARGDFKATSDTDVLVVLDDFRQPITQELAGQIHEELMELARKVSKRIYVADPPISAVQLIRNAQSYNPCVYVALKEGIAIYDRDFFVPFQESFQSTRKYVSLSNLSESLSEQSENLRRMERDFRRFIGVEAPDYFPVVSSAQLLLMGMGVEPPAPVKLYDAVEEHLVKPGFLKHKYANWLRRIVEGIKRFEHYPRRYSIRAVSNARQRFGMAKRFVREMQRVFTAHAKPDVIVLMTDGGEGEDRKFRKDKSFSISRVNMKELSEHLYLTRREFLKAVGVATVSLTSNCIDYFQYSF